MITYQSINENILDKQPTNNVQNKYFVSCLALLSFISGCNLVTKDEKSGSILSPQYPGYYTNDANCQWNLTVPEGHVIRLDFLYFDLEYHPKCSNDFVQVRDGLSKSSPLIGRFCGQSFPTTIESTGRGMLMIFKSNKRVIGGGFKARYHARQGTSEILNRHAS